VPMALGSSVLPAAIVPAPSSRVPPAAATLIDVDDALAWCTLPELVPNADDMERLKVEGSNGSSYGGSNGHGNGVLPMDAPPPPVAVDNVLTAGLQSMLSAATSTGSVGLTAGLLGSSSGPSDSAQRHGTKRPKADRLTETDRWFVHNDKSDSGSRDSTSDSGSASWPTGSFLIGKFTDFCAKLARKRSVAKLPAVSPLAPKNASMPNDHLKHAILEKIDALLQHGDETQLARIEKSLSQLHIDKEGQIDVDTTMGP